jgi:hypothetical protein
MKKIFFLSGLARSGNTLLASLLNQNKNIAVTANSIIFDILQSIDQFKLHQTFKNFPDHHSFNSITSNIIPNYYQNWNQSYIIDRSQITEDRLEFLKKNLKHEIKIIVLWRDLFEVLASFLKWSENKDVPMFSKGTSNEQKIDILMDKNTSNIITGLDVIRYLSKLENMHFSHFVHYDDLINNTELEIKEIYKFLNIPHFNHDFNSITDFKVNKIKYDDTIFGEGLHQVKLGKIEKGNYNFMDYIPEISYNKYKNLNIKPSYF